METKDINLNDIEVVENIRQRPLEEDLAELMESIKQNGLMQPIGLKQVGKGYILLWGFRRFIAYKKLGYHTIPANIFFSSSKITNDEDLLIINATENLQRKAINMVELGRICVLLKKTLSKKEISARLSIPLTRVENAMTEYARVPEKYRDKALLIDSNVSSKVRAMSLGSQLVKTLISVRGVSKEEKEELFDWAKREAMSYQKVRLLSVLLRSGMTLTQAKAKIENTQIFGMEFAMDKTKFEVLTFENRRNLRSITKEAINKIYPKLIF